MAKTWDAVLDPDEIRDFGVNWLPQITDNRGIVVKTITASTYSVESGSVQILDQSFTTTNTTVRLSGGMLGEICNLLNTVTLSDGERYEQTCQLRVAER